MKFISLFAGIGGFDLALERNGHECVYTNEWDKYAAQIYGQQFNHPVDTRDIKTVDAHEIPDHELLVGGFPCQAFSIAGKRRGFDDIRGTLFFDVARILEVKKPRLVMLENVKGLLNHDGGRTFATIIATLDELGYDLQWQVLNSKNFGVPQNRERVYIIGNLRGTPRPKIFPITGNDNQVDPTDAKIKQMTRGSQSQRVYDPSGLATTLQSQGGGVGAKTGLYAITIDEVVRIRKLTPTECERLQGFPDGWTAGASDNQRYKMCGNAVTVNVVDYIVKLLVLS